MKLLIPALCLLTFSVGCSPPRQKPPASPPPPDISAYRTWTRDTKEPYAISDFIAMRCFFVAGDVDFYHRAKKEPPNFPLFPHRKFAVHVYVNPVGAQAMKSKSEVFPVGSIVIKEKFAWKYSKGKLTYDKPVIFTMMSKRETGFDIQNGDWEYFAGKFPDLRPIKTQGGNLKSCQSCHSLYKDRDFITKSYLLNEELSQAIQKQVKLSQPQH